ncbi:MAG TPA: TetR/AcrR family transcriptional regulator [Polyangia bacterium]|jgi:AcrR family transcriptional regulator|nr:TetR/AcrR family transcriptional regulator [Polyangia bacterium]
MTKRPAATERGERPLKNPAAASTSTIVTGLPQPRTDLLRSRALAGAVELLTEEGWDAVTQARVATQSGLGRATVYRYWPDRRDLVRDAVLSANLAVRHQMPSSGNLREDLLMELRNLRSELIDGRLATVLAALIDRAEWEPELETVKVTVSRYAGRVLHMIVSSAVATGQIATSTNPEESISLLLGPLLYRRLVSVEDLSDSFLERVVDGYLAANAISRQPR